MLPAFALLFSSSTHKRLFLWWTVSAIYQSLFCFNRLGLCCQHLLFFFHHQLISVFFFGGPFPPSINLFLLLITSLAVFMRLDLLPLPKGLQSSRCACIAGCAC